MLTPRLSVAQSGGSLAQDIDACLVPDVFVARRCILVFRTASGWRINLTGMNWQYSGGWLK